MRNNIARSSTKKILESEVSKVTNPTEINRREKDWFSFKATNQKGDSRHYSIRFFPNTKSKIPKIVTLLKKVDLKSVPKLIYFTSSPNTKHIHSKYLVTQHTKNNKPQDLDKWNQNEREQFLKKCGKQLGKLHSLDAKKLQDGSKYDDWNQLLSRSFESTFKNITTSPPCVESILKSVRKTNLNREFEDAILNLGLQSEYIHVNNKLNIEFSNFKEICLGDPLLNLAVLEEYIAHEFRDRYDISLNKALESIREGYSTEITVDFKFKIRETWRVYQAYAKLARLRDLKKRDNVFSNVDPSVVRENIIEDIVRIESGEIIGKSPVESEIVESSSR